MRMYPALLLFVGLSLSACGDPGGPDPGGSSTGTLVVSTSTEGDDPDQDGFRLTVDGVDALALVPTGTVEVDLAPGRHTLRLLGVAEHCSVAPGTEIEVNVALQGTTPVAFDVTCPATGARVTVTSAGLDIDPDGYHVVVDGSDRGAIPSNGTALIRVDPGSRTIALTGLAPNCAVDGPGSSTVTIVATEVASIEFAVVCTATSGVIGVVISGSGVGAVYGAMVDGATAFPVGPGDRAYLGDVPAGDHVVSLSAPANCSVHTGPQSVTVTAGSLIRDTVEVTFSVTCASQVVGTLEITAQTTGRIPTRNYSVWICPQADCYDFPMTRLGALEPNGTLAAVLVRGLYQVELRDFPKSRCSVQGHNRRFVSVPDPRAGPGTSNFEVVCSP